MADYKRSIKCSGCGSEITVYMNGNFDLTELSAAGKCQSCRSTIQLDFAIVEKLPAEQPQAANAIGMPDAAALDMFSQTPAASEAQPQEASEAEAGEKSAEEETSKIIKDLMDD